MWLILENILGRFGCSMWPYVFEEAALDELAVYSWVELERSL